MKIKNISSVEAFEMLQKDDNALLVDVRTAQEWYEIGMPDIEASRLMLLSWRHGEDMSINPEFTDILARKIKFRDMKLLFLCKSGARSHEAAQIVHAHGFENCYNIVDGFEGGKNGAGWRHSDLPHTSVN